MAASVFWSGFFVLKYTIIDYWKTSCKNTERKAVSFYVGIISISVENVIELTYTIKSRQDFPFCC